MKNGGIPPVLVTRLCQIRHSLLFINVEQRRGSAAQSGMLSGRETSRPQNLVVACVTIPAFHSRVDVDPCSFLTMSKTIDEESDAVAS